MRVNTMKYCKLCNTPTLRTICDNCLSPIVEVDAGVLNRFMHSLASRQERKEIKLKDEEEDNEIQEEHGPIYNEPCT